MKQITKYLSDNGEEYHSEMECLKADLKHWKNIANELQKSLNNYEYASRERRRQYDLENPSYGGGHQ